MTDVKEIYQNMTKGEWVQSPKQSDAIIVEHTDGGNESKYYGGELIAESVMGRNQEAICTAINNTYGKGFDPSKVSEMYEMLESFERIHPLWLPPESVSPEHATEAEALCSMYRKLKDLLKSCKL